MKRNKKGLREIKAHNRMKQKEKRKMLYDYLGALIAEDIENSMKEFNKRLNSGEIRVEGYSLNTGLSSGAIITGLEKILQQNNSIG